MRVTIDIPEEVLAEAVKYTGRTKKSPAITAAVSEYVRMRKLREFADKLGTGEIGFSMTNEEIEEGDLERDRALYGKGE